MYINSLMIVFGSKVLKAYVILLWSGVVPRGGGGGPWGKLRVNEPHNDLILQLHVFICDYLLY